ncbi:multicomponent Na+:H+ antiporter subunit F [Chitinophaga terrae (ex Kim and Jung 2007)]|jgi:multicomponent Na+:H+ antiporter subunit F|uniref:Multicomponent Na+:H+ antiporter subunit F n=1 Tax=Chitinophaga terrae (ex Kim and Jung 2007) TaxID=408074 RepID=A0A1H4FE49_9BACT|nr:monovalent cation/H+ antiporter complex subunit F [Chitinophaga terrae (ex Kim and Jung 2007)]MDQ0110159.1 multicomponent Na+:H+ antiporter subunit F [Chitinophaga terrae (ex Kim and Jung 2007)]GEP92398.1 cation:proton antiporter [Chitinophaga terrae (ex Kim and Jung 2007)]SEA95623.1 multicomponent Na+:H+ antiporter subunit F [Chitinophaga terrae (ex Kim and Jung 2007)]
MNLNEYLTYVVLPILLLAVLLVAYRFFKGPAIVNRVIALDLLITIGIGIITIYSIQTGQSTFLDDAMILALIAFLGTIAFSYYLEKKKENE